MDWTHVREESGMELATTYQTLLSILKYFGSIFIFAHFRVSDPIDEASVVWEKGREWEG